MSGRLEPIERLFFSSLVDFLICWLFFNEPETNKPMLMARRSTSGDGSSYTEKNPAYV